MNTLKFFSFIIGLSIFTQQAFADVWIEDRQTLGRERVIAIDDCITTTEFTGRVTYTKHATNIAYERIFENYKVEISQDGWMSEIVERIMTESKPTQTVKIEIEEKRFSSLKECEFWVKANKSFYDLDPLF